MASMNSDIRVRGRNNGLIAGLIIGAATLALLVSVSVSLLPFTASAFGPTVVIDTVNGQPYSGHCVAGVISITGHGTRGSNGGPYSVDIGWGDGATTTVSAGSGSNGNFTFTATHTPTGVSSGLTLNLYHGSPSGSDTHVTTINQCVAAPTQGVLTVIKHVVGGSAVASNFTLHVKQGATDVTGSSFAGSETGKDFLLTANTYTVSEDTYTNYTQTSLSCKNVTNNVTIVGSSVALVAGKNYTCTITNTYAAPVNHNPIADAQTVSTPEDTQLPITLTGSDIDANSITFSTSTNPTHGTLTLVGAQATYTPAANFNGSDSFTFRAFDGTAYSTPATISITVTAVNDAPVASADSYGVPQDAPLTTFAAPGVLANDNDVEHDSLTAAWVSGPTYGTLAFRADGSFDYTPAAAFVGTDSFTYKANDGTSDSAPVQVTINVSANNVPVAVNDPYTTAEDTMLSVAAAGVLTNDTDADVADTLSAVLVTGPAHGTLTLNANGSFDYTPAANYNGTDSFTYKANDTKADSSDATVTITITAVNDAPVAASQTVSTVANTTLSGTVAATDADANTLTFSTTTNTLNGTLTLDANTGAFVYVPNTGFVGSDEFSFKANDGSLDSNTATTTITVTAAPVENTSTLCADGIDNDGDTLVDLSDPDCAAFIPAPVVTTPSNGGGNGGGGGGGVVSGPFSIGFVNTNNGGQVLGTSTEALPEGCSIYLNTYLKQGNTGSEVKKLQSFLNSYMNAGLPVSGVFGPMTFKAVQAFQLKHSDDVLAPWLPFGLASDHSATGYVYKTTKYKINLIQCSTLNLPKPQLP